MDDKEILAMSSVNEALKNLTEEERYRVIQWVANKYYSPSMPPVKVAGPTPINPTGNIGVGATEQEVVEEVVANIYTTFADLLDACGAKSEPDMFLVGAYWLQVIGSSERWKSFEVNKLLTPTGNGVKVSNAIRYLERRKPKPIIQVSQVATTSKSGSKEFKMTTEGIKTVSAMLQAE